MKECKNCGNCRHPEGASHAEEIHVEPNEATMTEALTQNEYKFEILAPAHTIGRGCASKSA